MTATTRPNGSLKKLVDVGKNPTRVLGPVERWILAAPKDTSRATDVIHPSAMVKPDWCHRAEYFTLQGAEPAPSKYAASLRQHLIFEEGHRIHARWQNWFGQMGKLYGMWQCVACNEKVWGLSKDIYSEDNDHDCSPSFGGWKYKEVPVSSPAHGISGHADGWLKNFGDDLLLEVKSIGEGTIRWEDPQFLRENDNDFKKAWKALKQPFAAHISQAQVYMKLLEINPPADGPTPKEAVFIYESKVDQETKEFIIPKSDFGISHLFEAASRIMDAIDKQQPPMCNINPSGTCAKCEVF